ncbi:MAG TPA: hypothetical protein VN442_05895 [Bryobacteraceae bacterium]|nr:hypothetical protein [Bryobacteraceae bacterium]
MIDFSINLHHANWGIYLVEFRFLALLALGGSILLADPAPKPEEIVANYAAASREMETALNGASMEVNIQASIPKLKKEGKLRALRHISNLGRITYEALSFVGDNTVKQNVIARYLTAEAQAQAEHIGSVAVTPENYKFKFKRTAELDGRELHVFQVSPRKKRVGLFKGEVWIDAGTHLRVFESGRLVKNPSIFLKKVEFVRKYEIRDGISVPRHIQSVVDTRLVGPAELRIDFTNLTLAEITKRASLQSGDR